MIVRYFLAIDGLDGGSSDAGHVGWFDLNSFEFDVSNTNGGAGSFPPLVADLNLDPALTGALADIAIGRQIRSIKIEGVTAAGQAVYDLTLANVSVTQLQQRNGGNDAVSFAYQRLGLLTQTQNPDGTFSPGSSFGWDLARLQSIDPTGLPAPTPGGSASVPATRYFLAIDGLDGGSSDAGHVGWFDLNSFEFDVSNTNGGAGSFPPLVADLNLDPALAGALADIAIGSQIRSIKIEGVTAAGQAVYDLTLANVSVTQLQQRNGGNDAVSFAYQRLGLLTQTQNPDGTFSPGSSFGWDLARLQSIDPTGLPAPTPGGSASVPATRYFLAIDGLDGGSSDAGHVGWFDLNSFEFDVSNTNGGAGSFPPLVADLNLDPALAGALADIAIGSQIRSIKIEGVTAAGQAVYDLTLANVSVTQLQQRNGGNDAVSFAYQRLGLLTQTQNPDGTFSPASSFGWDLARLQSIDPTGLPAPTPGGSASVPATRYFLAIDGLDGGSSDAGHVGWFDLNSFEFDVSNTNGGAGSFPPLVADLNLDPALAGALADIAIGSQIRSIKIEGVTAAGQAVYDLTLANVSVTQLQQRNGGNDAVSFAYQRLGLLTQTQNPDGTFSPGSSFGWDLARLQSIDPTGLPAPTPGGSASVPATRYFLAIDGLDGGSSDAGHVGWFDLNSFEFDVSNTNGGAGSFPPLVADLNLDPALAGALADIAIGSQIRSIKIEGVTAAGQAVYDLTLANVSVTQLQQRNGGNDAVSFAYQRLGLLTQTQNPDGTFSPGPSFGWDLARLQSIDPTGLPAPTPGGSASVPATRYFVAIDGLDGGSSDAGRVE